MGDHQAEHSCPACKAKLASGSRYCGGCGHAVVSTDPTQSGTDESASLVGEEVAGRYRIISKLGEGGMGAVYRAEQISLKRIVALKVLKPELSERQGLVRRFNAEAELAAKLSHPNTVTLYDFGQDARGALFIAMEFIDGQSLRECLVRTGPLPLPRIAAIGSQLCSSLSDAHEAGIVHRDLKPDNVMLSTRGKKSDIVTVLDFGIAKLREEEGKLDDQPMTRAGDMVGTPQYMAPEQIRGDAVDARTDVYALGVILYEMVTARLPFDGKTVMDLLAKHLSEAPIPPHRRRPDIQIDPNLEYLIMGCLAKSPNDRPASMDVVEDALLKLAPQTSSGVSHAPAQGASGFQANTPLMHAPSPVPGHPSSVHTDPRTTPTPVHRGAPTGAGQRQKNSRTGLWLMMAVLVLGAGGAAAYFASQSASDSDAEQASNPTDSSSSAASSGSTSPNPLVQNAVQTHKKKGDGPIGPPSSDMVDATYTLGTSYTDPDLSYRVDLPASFKVDLYDDGEALFTGMTKSLTMNIITKGWTAAERLNRDEVEAELKTVLSVMELELYSMRWRQLQGREVLQGRLKIHDTPTSGNFILINQGQAYYFAAIVGQAKEKEATKQFRTNFLEHHFHPPAN